MQHEPASLAIDARGLDALRQRAGRDPRAAVREAAVQFEALFTQMLLKTMRDAMPKSGMFDGPGHAMYEGMLDQQWAKALAGQPGGLAEAIARQLERQLGSIPADALGPDTAGAASAPAWGVPPYAPSAAGAASAASAASAVSSASAGARATSGAGAPEGAGRPATTAATQAAAASGGARELQQAFVERLWPHAQAAERSTGVPAAFIVGQAALESGWGRHEIVGADGRPSYNLFGIKAGRNWDGAVARTVTTEYVDGRPMRTVAAFRAYDSYEHAFRDWAALIAGSPRYADVLREGGSVEGFAQGLQQAGYATDPRYADKLTRTINQALMLRRLQI